MKTRQQYQISEQDWQHLIKCSQSARSAPVMALSIADGLAGNDFSSIAYRNVYEAWKALGRKYGFDGTDVEPVDEQQRCVSAYPLAQDATP